MNKFTSLWIFIFTDNLFFFNLYSIVLVKFMTMYSLFYPCVLIITGEQLFSPFMNQFTVISKLI